MNHWLSATLGNISVTRKLSLGFGTVLLLTLLITVTGWKGLMSVIDRGDKLANISQVITLIKDLRIARVTYDKDNGENGPDLLNEIGTNLAAAKERMVQASDLSLSDQELKAVSQYKTIFAAIDEATHPSRRTGPTATGHRRHARRAARAGRRHRQRRHSDRQCGPTAVHRDRTNQRRGQQPENRNRSGGHGHA